MFRLCKSRGRMITMDTIKKMKLNKKIDLKELKSSCSTCSLNQLCLPRGLNKESLIKLDYIIKNSSQIKKGSRLYHPNDNFKSLYAIRSGSAKVNIIDKNGKERVLGFYLPGEVIGFDAIHKQKYTCCAIALETLSYCQLPFERIDEICREIPEFRDQIFQLLSNEISNEHELLLMLSNKDAKERLAVFLINLSTRFKRLGYSSKEYNLPMSREEIANYLGLAAETVSRIFGQFKKSGLLTLNNRALFIKDMDSLNAIADG